MQGGLGFRGIRRRQGEACAMRHLLPFGGLGLRAILRLARDRKGVSAVEFALIAPVFLVILAGVIDVGQMMQIRSELNTAVSAGANRILLNGGGLSAGTAEAIASDVAFISAADTPGVTAKVTINNAFTVSMTGRAASASGKTSVADQCFCPNPQGTAVDWSVAVSCGAACPASDEFAAKYLEISVSRPYDAMFGGYGFLGNSIAVKTTVSTP
ncbi:TadE/TadG family type IV pilus assembly protein [Aquibium carbonis]|nr:TadE/TadG family type IV pilus assembly protein [Aquibium carbonis]